MNNDWVTMVLAVFGGVLFGLVGGALSLSIYAMFAGIAGIIVYLGISILSEIRQLK